MLWNYPHCRKTPQMLFGAKWLNVSSKYSHQYKTSYLVLHPAMEYWVDPTEGEHGSGELRSGGSDTQYSVWSIGFTASACGAGLMLIQVFSQRPLMDLMVTVPSINQKITLHGGRGSYHANSAHMSFSVEEHFTLGMNPRPERQNSSHHSLFHCLQPQHSLYWCSPIVQCHHVWNKETMGLITCTCSEGVVEDTSNCIDALYLECTWFTTRQLDFYTT